jgi:hypothetical protein
VLSRITSQKVPVRDGKNSDAAHQAMNNAFHVKKNNAALAPMWKAAIKRAVTEFT